MNEVKEIQERLQALHEVIRRANLEILEIRRSCTHPGFHVEMYSWRPGHLTPERVCDVCGAVVPGLTDKETYFAWRSFNGIKEGVESV